MSQTQIVHINFTGGIVSPGYLKEVLNIAASVKVTHVSFGLRQQLIMDVPLQHMAAFDAACKERNISYAKKKEALPNIVSSYPAAGIFTTDSWLREGVYKDVFSLFDYTPKLKTNICDSTQSFVPFFTGHLNWIASESAHFWYLYIRFPKTQTLFCCPELVYTNDVPFLSKYLEQLILSRATTKGNELYKEVKKSISYVAKAVDKKLVLPEFSFPYYEGFNNYDNTYWLGIYRRDELFPVAFLLDVCTLCMKTKIGQLYTTPWKSIIIKGIEDAHRKMWDYILGTYRINVRHAANELNWQVEDHNEDGLMLKRHIIRYFDKEDVRTYGLSFAVQTKPHTDMFGSVIIRKQPIKNPHGLKSLDRYEILYTKDFNPNSSETVLFRQYVEKEYLGVYLVSLCKFFYEQKSSVQPVSVQAATPAELEKQPSTKTVYQCSHCFTVYDEALGDEGSLIPAGTSFNDLPDDYHCPLCEADKADFIAIEETALLPQSL